MTEHVAAGSIQFACGKPDFEFDECYRCFEGKNILFRLVNKEKKTWAFFNDTADTVVKVRTIFKAGSVIQPLQRTRIRAIPKADGTVDATCEQEATIEVGPGQTEVYIEGAPLGFNMSFQSESAPAQDVHFEFVRPSVPYDKMYKCFKNNGNGLLFRLVDDADKKWSFYNDTKDYIMKVAVDFSEKAEVTPLGNTQPSTISTSTWPKGIIYTLEIPPGITLPFIQGIPSVYKLDFAAEPVVGGTGEQDEDIRYAFGKPDPAIIPHQSHVYKCFKEHGNGLLFRIVDDVNFIWAFFNDTVDYNMTVNVRFPANTDVQLAPGVSSVADDAVPGGFIASVSVPPLTTVPFLVGQPATFELAFTANAAAPKVQPVEHPEFENGVPDTTVLNYKDVYKCFKDHGNGLLFRLVDPTGTRWAFYNDTKDIVMNVKVSFASDAKVIPLASTRVETDPENGTVYILDVEPLQTSLFAQGDLGVFTTKFSAMKKAPQ